MSGMQNIVTAVRENDFFAGVAKDTSISGDRFERRDL